jgi:hypothetical protein
LIFGNFVYNGTVMEFIKMRVNGKDFQLALEAYSFTEGETTYHYRPTATGGAVGHLEFHRPNEVFVTVTVAQFTSRWSVTVGIAGKIAIFDCEDTKKIDDPKIREVTETALEAWAAEAIRKAAETKARRAEVLARLESPNVNVDLQKPKG